MKAETKQGLFAAALVAGLIVILAAAWASRNTAAAKGTHHIDRVRPGGVLPK